MKALLLTFSFLLHLPLAAQKLPVPEVLPAGKDAIYKAEFRHLGTSMNGFLAVTHKRNHVLQVSFTSVMGTNLLEMVWKKGRWRKVYVSKSLDRRGLIEMLQEDIMLMFLHFCHDHRAVDKGNVWLWNKRHIHLDMKDGELVRLRIKTKRHLPSREVNYAFDENSNIEELTVSHTGHTFSLGLQPLKKEKRGN